MLYKGGETESSSIYDFKIRGEKVKGSDTENKILEYLTPTNNSLINGIKTIVAWIY